MDTQTATQAAELATPSFSMASLLIDAHWSIQLVLLVLLGMSIWTWTIVIAKHLQLNQSERHSRQFERDFWSSTTMMDLAQKAREQSPSTSSAVFVCVIDEWVRFSSRPSLRRDEQEINALQDRMERLIESTMLHQQRILEERISFLAGISSTSPFIGLFGTVVGIVSAFSAIANNTTQATLTAVAPGIAEALFATAIGLLAAIPASWFYNRLVYRVQTHMNQTHSFAQEFMTVFTRQLRTFDPSASQSSRETTPSTTESARAPSTTAAPHRVEHNRSEHDNTTNADGASAVMGASISSHASSHAGLSHHGSMSEPRYFQRTGEQTQPQGASPWQPSSTSVTTSLTFALATHFALLDWPESGLSTTLLTALSAIGALLETLG